MLSEAAQIGIAVAAIVFVLVLIIAINCCVCYANKYYKAKQVKKDDFEQRMVNMQTQRVIDGKAVQQVIIKGQPNGNMDKMNHNNIPYKTIDSETNMVRYDTEQVDSAMVTFHEPPASTPSDPRTDFQTSVEVTGSITDLTNSNLESTVLITQSHVEPTPVATDEIDSGTGDSPTRTSEGYTNMAAEFNDDEDETPYGIPPPPESMPPPLTPVTDLDAPSDEELPPPPPAIPLPPANDYIYAEIKKDKKPEPVEETNGASVSNEQIANNIWRPRSVNEIEIIEIDKF